MLACRGIFCATEGCTFARARSVAVVCRSEWNTMPFFGSGRIQSARLSFGQRRLALSSAFSTWPQLGFPAPRFAHSVERAAVARLPRGHPHLYLRRTPQDHRLHRREAGDQESSGISACPPPARPPLRLASRRPPRLRSGKTTSPSCSNRCADGPARPSLEFRVRGRSAERAARDFASALGMRSRARVARTSLIRLLPLPLNRRPQVRVLLGAPDFLPAPISSLSDRGRVLQRRPIRANSGAARSDSPRQLPLSRSVIG